MTKNCTFCYFRLNNHFLSAAKNIKHIDFDVSRFKSDMRRPCPFFFRFRLFTFLCSSGSRDKYSNP